MAEYTVNKRPKDDVSGDENENKSTTKGQANPGEIVFIVGQHRVRVTALRGLLALSTPVFRQLFKEYNETNEITLLNTDSEAFQIMLEFINGTNIKNKINQTNMLNLLNISSEYKLEKLSSMTSKIIKSSLNRSNIREIFSFAQVSGDENLKELIWKWLGGKSSNIADPSIGEIFKQFNNGKEIAEFLQKDYISINEERIFIHCLNWVKLQYTKQESQQLSARELVQDFIEYIRFPTMSNKFLTSEVYNSGILTNDELLHILRAKTCKNQSFTPYIIAKRNNNDNGDEKDEEEDDDEFDTVNLEDDDEDDEDDEAEGDKEKDITSSIEAIACSSEYSTSYTMIKMFENNDDYWCTVKLSQGVDAYVIFDCGKYLISRIEIKFPPSEGACSICKVYSTNIKKNVKNVRLNNWDKITKKINMSKNGSIVEKVKIRNENISRYVLLNFEDGQGGYAGIQKIKFFATKNE